MPIATSRYPRRTSGLPPASLPPATRRNLLPYPARVIRSVQAVRGLRILPVQRRVPRGRDRRVEVGQQPGRQGQRRVAEHPGRARQRVPLTHQQHDDRRHDEDDHLLVGQRETEGERRAHEEPGPLGLLVPAHEQVDEHGRQQVGQREDLEHDRPLPEHRREREARCRDDGAQAVRGQPAHGRVDDADAGTRADGRVQAHPKGVRADRQPAEHVGSHGQQRVSRGVGDAQDLGHRLEFGGVPGDRVPRRRDGVEDERGQPEADRAREIAPIGGGCLVGRGGRRGRRERPRVRTGAASGSRPGGPRSAPRAGSSDRRRRPRRRQAAWSGCSADVGWPRNGLLRAPVGGRRRSHHDITQGARRHADPNNSRR